MKIRSKLGLYFPTSFLSCSLALLVFSLLSCQDYNSHTFDKNKFSDFGCAAGEAADFCLAYEVLKSNCINCHEGFHDDWAATEFTLESKWINTGLIIPGNALGSKLYKKLWSQVPVPSGDPMPPEGALSNSEDQTIFNWIN